MHVKLYWKLMYTKSVAPHFMFLIYLSIREPIRYGCIIGLKTFDKLQSYLL